MHLLIELTKNLTIFNYEYSEKDNKIVIDLGFWQQLIIIIDNDKLKFEERLKGWNMLTTFPTSFKTALFISPLFVIIFWSIFTSSFTDYQSYFGILIALNIMLVTFSIYYSIRFEGIKTKIAIWLQ